MPDGWENYYLLIGSAAGALIGLMFVVVTLTAGRDRDQSERGKHLYTSPIVWHLAVVLLLVTALRNSWMVTLAIAGRGR
jgi:formate/nitrite transporter FocA (FNT family)